jgi:hypothetical protein
MNERIKELRKQAWDYVVSCDEHLSKSATDLFEEKFAELIVKECLYQVADARIENDFEPVGDVALVQAMTGIKKYFGVEE